MIFVFFIIMVALSFFLKELEVPSNEIMLILIFWALIAIIYLLNDLVKRIKILAVWLIQKDIDGIQK